MGLRAALVMGITPCVPVATKAMAIA